MKRRKRNKKIFSILHAQKRANERYDCFFSNHDIREMASLCQTGKIYCHLGKISLTRSKIVINYKNNLIPVIYDKKRHCLVTVLLIEGLSKEEKDIIAQVGEQ